MLASAVPTVRTAVHANRAQIRRGGGKNQPDFVCRLKNKFSFYADPLPDLLTWQRPGAGHVVWRSRWGRRSGLGLDSVLVTHPTPLSPCRFSRAFSRPSASRHLQATLPIHVEQPPARGYTRGQAPWDLHPPCRDRWSGCSGLHAVRSIDIELPDKELYVFVAWQDQRLCSGSRCQGERRRRCGRYLRTEARISMPN